jgi:predicted CoA-substrate-specific enzyme activase
MKEQGVMTSKNTETKALGICLGASTISAVRLIKDEKGAIRIDKVIRKHHEGNPKDEFRSVLYEMDPGEAHVLVTGRKFRDFVRFPSITEPEASEYALTYIAGTGKKFDTLVSAGGETFMVYRLDKGQKVIGISTGNKCASGTGEFFLQQIKRMDLKLDAAVAAAEKGNPYSVSGRCSVFCKSDCTHALNKGVPIENVTAGLCEMIAEKISELVAKIPHENIIIVGGTALNNAVMQHVKKSLNNITIPAEAPYFEALGAAIAAFDKGKKAPIDIFNEGHSNFSRLPALKDAEQLVKFNEAKKDTAKDGDICLLGLDVGSTTTKAVLMRKSDDKILASIYLRTNGNPVEASRNCYKSIVEQLKGTKVKIDGIGVTGSGRQIAGLYSLTDGIINEIIAHAAAAVYFDPEVDTIFEIGGQDAKYTHLTNGVASDYAMNEACSAGTGSFLEESALESFNVNVKDIAELALKGNSPPNFSDQCAAFISSDIKNASHEGISKEDILAGLVYSICFNYANRVKGHRPIGNKVFMQGGVCYNKAVPLAMASILKKEIIVPPEPGLMGAFGVALELKKRLQLGLMEKGDYKLEDIINREISSETPFICAGGKEKCDLKCSINRMKIEGKIYSFGGACNRYYNMRFKIEVDTDRLDLVKVRNRLCFEKYAPAKPVKPNTPVIGINKSLLIHQLFPLYYNFFANLGCKVIVPTKVNEDAFNRQTSSFCFPAQVAIGLFDDLTDMNPDFYFMPHLEEMYVAGGIERKEFSATCIFTQGEGLWIQQLFKDKNLEGKILAPTINFSKGFESATKDFIKIARGLGFGAAESEKAYLDAIQTQRDYKKERKLIGAQALEELAKTPDVTAYVLFGPPHNALTDETNKGIPKKFSSRGKLIIPFDMLPIEGEKMEDPYEDYMHWEMGQKIIRGAQIVKKNDQLFGVYITNFLCAMDSLLVTYFRKIMETKPSLTLEIDGHTADAGVDTRIEAFLDVVKNYLEVQSDIKDAAESGVKMADTVMDNTGIYMVDSEGKKISLKDPRVKLIIPSMGDLSNTLVAAAFQKIGINGHAMPIPDKEVLSMGRSVTTGKECLPMILCIGQMLKYLEEERDPEERTVVFQPRAAGYCRLGQYHVYMNMLIKERKLKNVALISLANEERYAGLGTSFTLNAWKSIIAGDVLDDIRNAIMTIAENPDEGMKVFNEEHQKIYNSMAGKSKTSFYQQLKETAARLKTIKTLIPFDKAPQVPVMGEIFVRRDSFSNKDIAKRLAEKGFIARTGYLSEWLYYLNYMIDNKLQEPDHTLTSWIEYMITAAVQQGVDKKIKKILEKSGLYETEMIDMESIIDHSTNLLPKTLKGEPGITIGITMRDVFSKFAGAVNIGPFSCMPVRFTEAVAFNNLDMKGKMAAHKEAGTAAVGTINFGPEERIPFLTIEADGNPYPQLLEARFESFCLQAGRVAERQGKKVIVRDYMTAKK